MKNQRISAVLCMLYTALCVIEHDIDMDQIAYFHPKFKAEFDELSVKVQDELLAMLTPLRQYGPALGRPEVDTLKDSGTRT